MRVRVKSNCKSKSKKTRQLQNSKRCDTYLTSLIPDRAKVTEMSLALIDADDGDVSVTRVSMSSIS